jgi:hypothetical protein
MARLALVLVSFALFAAGCDGGNEPNSSATETESGPIIDGTMVDPVIGEASNTETALLSDVDVSQHEGYDRVVFEFRNNVPGYDVRYAELPVIEDGSGMPVDNTGLHVVTVRMEPALDADPTKDNAPMTYTGPSRFSPDATVINELIRVGGFEGVLTWAISASSEVPFLVSTLDNPPRLVVDLKSG